MCGVQTDCLRWYLAHLQAQGEVPRALMLHLTVDKPTSIERQQFRFRQALRFNESVRRTARGTFRCGIFLPDFLTLCSSDL